MKGYVYYSKNDPKKEPIFSWTASSKEQAIEGFARLKKLSVEEFKNLFEVTLYDQTQTNTSHNA